MTIVFEMIYGQYNIWVSTHYQNGPPTGDAFRLLPTMLGWMAGFTLAWRA